MVQAAEVLQESYKNQNQQGTSSSLALLHQLQSNQFLNAPIGQWKLLILGAFFWKCACDVDRWM